MKNAIYLPICISTNKLSIYINTSTRVCMYICTVWCICIKIYQYIEIWYWNFTGCFRGNSFFGCGSIPVGMQVYVRVSLDVVTVYSIRIYCLRGRLSRNVCISTILLVYLGTQISVRTPIFREILFRFERNGCFDLFRQFGSSKTIIS